MKYPKMSEKLDLRKKLTKIDILIMKDLLYSGYSKRAIGRKMGVSSPLVCYHLNGVNYKNKWNQKVKNI